MPAGQRASYNPRESTDGRWVTAAEALEQNDAGEMIIAPPTLCILQDLGRHATVDAALQAAPDAPVEPKMPELLMGSDLPSLLLPGDHRHSAGQGDGEDYAVLEEGRWRRVRGPG